LTRRSLVNTYRRGSFRIWFFEVGFLYLVAFAHVAVFFLLKEFGAGLPSIRQSLDSTSKQEVPRPYPPSER
jgi:hypothetical protein